MSLYLLSCYIHVPFLSIQPLLRSYHFYTNNRYPLTALNLSSIYELLHAKLSSCPQVLSRKIVDNIGIGCRM